MSEILATSPRLPDEAPTVEGRLADLMRDAEVRVDGYRLSVSDRAKVIAALRTAPAMLTLLKEIDATWPVATSELRERARKVIAEADGQSGDQK